VQSPIIPFRPPWRCAVSLPMLAGRGGERGKVVHDRHGNLAPRRRPSAPRHRQRGCRRTGASSWRPTQEPPPPPHSPRALLRLYPAERKLPVAAPRPAPRRRNARRGRRRNLDPRRVACVASRDGRWGRGTRLTRLHATRTGVSEVRGHTPGKAGKRSAAHALLPATARGPHLYHSGRRRAVGQRSFRAPARRGVPVSAWKEETCGRRRRDPMAGD